MPELPPRPLGDFPVRSAITTRWSDNDMYGHLNNARYYELFDTTINAWIAEHTGASFEQKSVIGVVAESGCRFHTELSFPGILTVGLRVERVGRSSVTYCLGLFDGEAPAEDAPSSATGHWVHVYIDREAKGSTPIPDDLRSALQSIA